MVFVTVVLHGVMVLHHGTDLHGVMVLHGVIVLHRVGYLGGLSNGICGSCVKYTSHMIHKYHYHYNGIAIMEY